MSMRKAAAMTALVLMAGCSSGPVSPPDQPAPGPVSPPGPAAVPAAPLSLTVSPESSTPGSAVSVTLRVREPHQVARRQADGSLWGWICFRECGGEGVSTSVTFLPAPGDPGLFSAQFIVPVVVRRSDGGVRFDPVAAGEYQIHAACVTEQGKGCASRSEVSTSFRVSAGLGTVDWQRLPADGATPMRRLGSMETTSRSPLPGSQRSVECVAGNLAGPSGEAPPRLLRTDDGGRQLAPINLGKGGPLFGRHGSAGCEAAALDPAHPGTFYILESRHAGGTEPGPYPWPQFTRDGGATWAPVPAPDGFEARMTFVGFTVAEGGVTAWFSQATLEERSFAGERIRGRFTGDGGQSWATVEPTCPGGSPACLWQVRDRPPMMRHGLIRSADGGQTWSWAALGGIPLAVDQVYTPEGSDGQVLEAVNGSPVAYWGSIPLLRSGDGGATWLRVEVPPPPGGWFDQFGNSMPFRLEPDGALILEKKDGAAPARRYRLARGNTEWELSQPAGERR